MRSMPRVVSLAVLLVLIILLGATFFRVIAPFLMPLFLAGVTAVICQPLFRYFLSRTQNRLQWAAGLTTATIMTALMLPIIVGTLMASLQLYTLAAGISIPEFRKKSEVLVEKAVDFGNQFLPADQQRDVNVVTKELQLRLKTVLQELGDRSLGRAAGTTIGVLAGTAGQLVSIGISVLIYTVALFYFLSDGTNLLKAAEGLIPVHADYQRELLEQFAKVVRSVVVATFMAAIGQGVATTAALWLFGFPHIFVLLVLSTLFALIPMAGTWVVWFPCAVMLYADGHWIQGTILFIYGAAFVGFLDNVIRTYILNTDTKLHPLLAFISVLGGLQVMGLWGVFVGPIVASCLHALVKIFNTELTELSKERQSEQTEIPLNTITEQPPKKSTGTPGSQPSDEDEESA